MGISDQIFRIGTADILDGSITAAKIHEELAQKATPDYLVWIDDLDSNVIKARNEQTGVIVTEGADARTVIQAAIDAAVTAGKRRVHIKKGTYSITGASINLNGHVVLTGDGQEATELQLAASQNRYILVCNSTNAASQYRVQIRDIKFDGNGSNQTGDSGGIKAFGIIQSTIENCHFENCRNKGVWLYDTGGGSGSYGHHNQIVNCLFDQGEGLTEGIGLYMRNNDENTVLASQFQYLELAIKDDTGFNQIVGCSIVDGQDGIQLLDCWRTRIVGCIFDKCAKRGAWIKGYRNAIVGCTFYDISDGNANGYPCVDIDYYGHNSISGCVFTAHDSAGITRSYVKETSPTHSTKGHNVISGCVFDAQAALGTGEFEFSETTNTILGNSGLVSTNPTYCDKDGNQFTLRDAPVLLKKFTLSAASAAQSYTLDTGYEIFDVIFRIAKSASTGAGTFGMRLNALTSGYKQNTVSYSTLANPNTSAFKFNGGGTGTEVIFGRVTFHRKGIGSNNSVHVVGPSYAGDQFVWFGGRAELAGDVTSIEFDDYDSDSTFTGEILIYGRKGVAAP